MGGQSAKSNALGNITAGVEPSTLATKTIEFVYTHLPCWRDDPERRPERAEEPLNAQLCKFLDVAARTAFPMVYFHHEERQAARRRVDLSALPTQTVRFGASLYTKYNPILVMEGKRLPAPSRDREMEYMTGLTNQSGGIQRFKLGLHGAELDRAVMITYIQQGRPPEWHQTINAWIGALAAGTLADLCGWTAEEQLEELASAKARSALLVLQPIAGPAAHVRMRF